MATTVLGGVLDFFKELGIYDVVLPFILVFTIMFAILERTKIFGTEGEKKFTKKNLNNPPAGPCARFTDMPSTFVLWSLELPP